ncbi:MAG TPA: helix-turn-helix transcriptional regulator [Actinophytocola sp.]|uniref:helix-turn-helix domain-containing protein n=1 Tax=Actinophytocola sp. TaxID=1872138 RepID=UPI002DDC9410|nr:helix-turn-helix transcriptional regulator [Actinophytocola sp.]HEV2782849.1 helix-turn-helix transcriptional regulator [Actinophytocola sp.]
MAGEERLGEAWLLVARGDPERARTVLADAAATAAKTGHLSSEALLRTDMARLGAANGVTDRLAELARLCDGPFASARAHLAAALAAGDPAQLLDVTDELEQVGASLLAAEAATAAASALHLTGKPRAAAAAAVRATTLAAQCQGARTPLLATTRTSHPLTDRERQIALLAAAGTPSRDIAAALTLSVRTINNHLHRTYTKLGVTNRAELAKALTEKPA